MKLFMASSTGKSVKKYLGIVAVLVLITLFVPVDINAITVTGAPVTLDKEEYILGDRPIVSVSDIYSDFDPNKIDSIQVVIKAKVGPGFVGTTLATVTLFETGPNTRVFSGVLPTITPEYLYNRAAQTPNKFLEVSYLLRSTYNSDLAFLIQDPEYKIPGYEGQQLETNPNPNVSGCLIATAAFGSELAPQVQFLREIRDNTVLQTESGSAFMTGFNQFYYSFSPAIADYERENPIFKEAVKLTLTPLLASLTLLQYADIDSESEMLGYGIGIILLNIGMYFVAPAVLIMKVRKEI